MKEWKKRKALEAKEKRALEEARRLEDVREAGDAGGGGGARLN